MEWAALLQRRRPTVRVCLCHAVYVKGLAKALHCKSLLSQDQQDAILAAIDAHPDRMSLAAATLHEHYCPTVRFDAPDLIDVTCWIVVAVQADVPLDEQRHIRIALEDWVEDHRATGGIREWLRTAGQFHHHEGWLFLAAGMSGYDLVVRRRNRTALPERDTLLALAAERGITLPPDAAQPERVPVMRAIAPDTTESMSARRFFLALDED